MFSQLITESMAGGTPALMEFGVAPGKPGMMEFTISGGGWNSSQVLRRDFRKVDTLTGTPEADNFKLQSPGFGTQSLDQIDFENNLIVLGIDRANDLIFPFDVTADSEVDILVYQEQERATYLVGFQAPTASSYTYIEDFNPLEDEFQILGLGGRGHVKIMSDENDIPMLTDAIQPAFGM